MMLDRNKPIFDRSKLKPRRPTKPDQDRYFNHHCEQKTPLCFRTIAGREYTGVIIEVKNYTILVEREGTTKILLMKAALESVEKVAA